MIPAGHTKFTSLVWMKRIKWTAVQRRENQQEITTVGNCGQPWLRSWAPGIAVEERVPAGPVQGCSAFQQWWRAWGGKKHPSPSPCFISTRASIGPTQPEVSWCRNSKDSVYRGCPPRPQSSVDSGSQPVSDADDWKLTQWWELSLNGTGC